MPMMYSLAMIKHFRYAIMASFFAFRMLRKLLFRAHTIRMSYADSLWWQKVIRNCEVPENLN